MGGREPGGGADGGSAPIEAAAVSPAEAANIMAFGDEEGVSFDDCIAATAEIASDCGQTVTAESCMR